MYLKKMKNRQIMAVFLLLSISVAVNAQNEITKFKITDAYILAGVQSTPQSVTSFTDMLSLAPQSVLLQQDFTGYNSYTYRGYYGTGNVAFRVGLQSLKKPNRELQLAVSYGSGVQISNYRSRDRNVPYDTFTSAQTGEQIIVDSVYTSHVSSQYTTDQLQIEASYIFRTDHLARWSFYGGIGAGVGTSLRASTSVFAYESSYANILSLSDDYSRSYFSSNFDEGSREEFENQNVVSIALFIPAGIDFRIGKENAFWQQIHLFIEARPSIGIVNVPELDVAITPALHSNIGFRLHW
jgi:hypothetical protein